MTDDQTRPEVVQAAFDALYTMDPAKIAALAERTAATGVTPAEREQAEDLFVAALDASREHRSRRLKTYEILLAGHSLASDPTWAQLFDGLSAADVERLRDLYDALPDGARAEFDRRYGAGPAA